MISSVFTSSSLKKTHLKLKSSIVLITNLTTHHQNLHTLSSNSTFSVGETFFKLLHHCNSKSLNQGIHLHSSIIKINLNANLYIANNLLSLYSKCLGPSHARKLFDEMPVRDVVSWTGIISAYVQSGDDETALKLFRQMVVSGTHPNQFTYASILRCARSVGEFDLGTCVHARIVKQGFGSNVVLASALLDFYSKGGELEDALQIFSQVEFKDMMLWTAMVSALDEAGDWSGALEMFLLMIASGVSPNEFTFVKILMACSFLGLLYGELVHAQLILRGIELKLVLKTALVNMYCKCMRMRDALKVLKLTPESDVMLWTSMISGCNQAGDHKEAVATLQAMEISGAVPNSVTFTTMLNACITDSVLEFGMQIHSRVTKAGLDRDLSIGNTLLELYAKLSPSFDDLTCAFGALHSPNVFSWTALIAGLTRHMKFKEAFVAFTDMRAVGIEPDSYTLSAILKGFGSTSEALAQAMRIHAYVLKTNVDAFDAQMVIGNSLVDAYARLRRIDDAWTVAYTMLPRRDALTYTSFAKGLNQMSLHRQALDILTLMMYEENVRIDGVSLSTFISATAGLAAIDPGKQLHGYALKSGLNNWISVSNGLIDMYSKCGRINEARSAFIAIPKPNLVSWNCLISGLASNGHFSDALSSFEDMRLEGLQPDEITMLVVLHACSHGGLVDLGVEYFNSMRELYNVRPKLDHYVCLVDLLGRAGRLEAAACAIEMMGFKVEDPLIYKTLLNCCKMHGSLVMGECMARQAMELDPFDPTVYVMLAGMYDDAGKMEMGEEIRRMMRERGLNKCSGQRREETKNLHADCIQTSYRQVDSRL